MPASCGNGDTSPLAGVTVKFLVEVLPEWPADAKAAGHFKPASASKATLVYALGNDESTAAPGVLQSPAFAHVPQHAVVRITRLLD
jgi:hypothetical protein